MGGKGFMGWFRGPRQRTSAGNAGTRPATHTGDVDSWPRKLSLLSIIFLEKRGWMYDRSSHGGQFVRFEHPVRGHAIHIMSFPNWKTSYVLQVDNYSKNVGVHT